jgi:hypothetical protein
MPNFESPIVVASLAALADIHVAEIDDGVLAYVQSLTAFYVLEKASGAAPNGVTIIAPNQGSPIAGAAGARWIFLVSPGGAIVTPFRMIPVPTAFTLSAVPVPLMAAAPPVSVIAPGDILLDFDASIEITPPQGTNFQGASFDFLWDGAALADNAFFELDPGLTGTAFDTFAMVVRLRSLITGVAVGLHTLSVRWNVFDAACRADANLGSGNLTIQTAPR